MYAINSNLSQVCDAADGRYLDAIEMRPFEQYITTYKHRMETYQILHESSNKLVLGALKTLSVKYPELIRSKGKRCHYDMTTTLRYIALSILRDDEQFFQDSVVIWLDTVLVAHQRHHQCAEAYGHLFEEITQHLPKQALSFVRPYMDSVIQLFDSHVN